MLICVRLTNNHDVELKADLHGLASHLVQHCLNAHISKQVSSPDEVDLQAGHRLAELHLHLCLQLHLFLQLPFICSLPLLPQLCTYVILFFCSHGIVDIHVGWLSLGFMALLLYHDAVLLLLSIIHWAERIRLQLSGSFCRFNNQYVTVYN